MYHKIYKAMEEKLAALVTNCKVVSGRIRSDITKPALFLTVLPSEPKRNRDQKECKVKVEVECVSGESFYEDLKLADTIIKSLSHITFEERKLMADEIETIYNANVLSVKGQYTFTVSNEEESNQQVMETLSMRQKILA